MQEDGIKPTRILVPTDFSPSAKMAVSTAAAFATAFGSTIYLLHVIPMLPIVPEPGYPSMIFPEQEYLANAKRYAEEKLLASAKALLSKGIEASFGTQIGNDVVGNIMTILKRERSDLLMISTHGLSGWRPIVFGSIAEQVIKLVECPLLLLRTPKSST